MVSGGPLEAATFYQPFNSARTPECKHCLEKKHTQCVTCHVPHVSVNCEHGISSSLASDRVFGRSNDWLTGELEAQKPRRFGQSGLAEYVQLLKED